MEADGRRPNAQVEMMDAPICKPDGGFKRRKRFQYQSNPASHFQNKNKQNTNKKMECSGKRPSGGPAGLVVKVQHIVIKLEKKKW